jgi:branched-chain amino acid transport system ATP-binding protein
MATPPTLLRVQQLAVSYGGLAALDDVAFSLAEGEVLGVAGPNGAGKSSLLKALAGVVRPAAGRVAFGEEPVFDAGARVARGPRWAVRHGIVLVPEGRHLFGDLSVEENLRFGAYLLGAHRFDEDLERVYTLFPKLRERRQQKSATLSGGEQQMVAIGRGLMARPRLLLLDEMSLGLAPAIAAEVSSALARLREQTGLTMIVVDESLKRLARMTSRVLFLARGRVHTELDSQGMRVDEANYLLSSF